MTVPIKMNSFTTLTTYRLPPFYGTKLIDVFCQIYVIHEFEVTFAIHSS